MGAARRRRSPAASGLPTTKAKESHSLAGHHQAHLELQVMQVLPTTTSKYRLNPTTSTWAPDPGPSRSLRPPNQHVLETHRSWTLHQWPAAPSSCQAIGPCLLPTHMSAPGASSCSQPFASFLKCHLLMLNWTIGIDMYTLMCIKLMTNKNLQYKKTNKQKTNTKLSLGYLHGNMLI